MRLSSFCIALVICSCPSDKRSKLDSFSTIEISKVVLLKLEDKAGKKFRWLTKKVWVPDSTNKAVFVPVDSVSKDGIEIPFVEDGRARQVVREFQQEIAKTGYYIYLKNLDFDEQYSSYYDIVVARVTDQFELVRRAETEAPNYDLSNEQIIERLKAWNSKSPFRILVADYDRIEADFIKLPEDRLGFAKEVYAFCPDVIDQGIGSEEELAEYFKTEKSFWLWWD